MVKNEYTPDWSSLSMHPVPTWFKDAKFGIYTHWGPYSVAAFGQNGSWYPNKMYRPDTPEFHHHCRTFGHPSQFGYKDLIPLFEAKQFDAEEWADLFRRAGAQYAGPVAEHHDGFSMWNSRVNNWNAQRKGPKRDIVGELEKAIRARGMKFIATFHHSHNWWYYPTWDKTYDCSDPAYQGLYSRPHPPEERPDRIHLERWLTKLKEVVDGYSPDLIWFDFGLGSIKESYRKAFLAYYFNKGLEWNKEVAVTYKEMPKGWHNLPPNTAIVDLEVGKMNTITNHPWLTDTSVDASPGAAWSHVRNVGFKSPERLIHNLIDRVSKNGHLLLNVGPRADGTIPEGARSCLLEMGDWLNVNGEAIYGTSPWLSSGEGPTQIEGGGHFNETNEVRFTAHDMRYTVKGNNLYAIVLGRPGDRVTFKTLSSFYEDEIESVEMLGSENELGWFLNENGLNVEVPEELPGRHAFTFRIRLRLAL